MFGIKVEKFFLFFDAGGKKLFSFKKGDTEYGVGWLPLGGYVKIAGMIDESMDKEQLKKEPEDWEFRSKPAWQKLIVMLAGIFFNVILGIFLFTVISLTQKEYLPLSSVGTNYDITEYGKEQGLQEGDVILGVKDKEIHRADKDLMYALAFGNELEIERNGAKQTITIPKDYYKEGLQQGLFTLKADADLYIVDVDKGKAAKSAGIKAMDKVLRVDGTSITDIDEFTAALQTKKNGTSEVTVERDGKAMTLPVQISEEGTMGITVQMMGQVKKDLYDLKPIGLGTALSFGLKDAFMNVVINAKGLGKVFSGKEKAKDTLAGPVQIAKMFGAKWNWARLWELTAMLSMVLAFVNILPIPALDGGHAVFAIIEMVTGKEVNQKILEFAQIVGFFIVMALMVFIFYNDIRKVFFGG